MAKYSFFPLSKGVVTSNEIYEVDINNLRTDKVQIAEVVFPFISTTMHLYSISVCEDKLSYWVAIADGNIGIITQSREMMLLFIKRASAETDMAMLKYQQEIAAVGGSGA
jgi:hypothetical protein